MMVGDVHTHANPVANPVANTNANPVADTMLTPMPTPVPTHGVVQGRMNSHVIITSKKINTQMDYDVTNRYHIGWTCVLT